MIRDEIITLIRRDLIGPSNVLDNEDSRCENLSENPIIKYLSGILEPIGSQGKQKETDGGEEEKSIEDAISSISQSTMGLSFVLGKKASLSIEVNFGVYASENRFYKRKPITLRLKFQPNELKKGLSRRTIYSDGVKKMELLFVSHLSHNGGLIIATLINSTLLDEDRRPSYKECFFQVQITVGNNSGFKKLTNEDAHLTRDDQMNNLLYHEYERFGSGHGCSIKWDGDESSCKKIRSSFMPEHIIDALIHHRIEVEDKLQEFDMLEMANIELREKWIPSLRLIPHDYLSWLEKQDTGGLGDNLIATASDNKQSIHAIIRRINRGIDLIESDSNVQRAFCLANEAMLLQQLRYKSPVTKFTPQSIYHEISIGDKTTWPQNVQFPFGKWRLFQIAFLLMNLGSVARLNEEDRGDSQVFDLIWFPTGGGKTEAYLVLTAFTLFYELLTESDNRGVSVLMRYTLRLLSSQQFERASALIVACNDVKQTHGIPGSSLSIGLWVGRSATPNTRSQAESALSTFMSEGKNVFSVTKCPRCNSEFGLNESQELNGFRMGAKGLDVHCLVCCEEKENLPVYIVDQDIKRVRPKLLIGTVDKFALLAWDSTNRWLLGVDVPTKNKNSPLKLIIQDELHLIDGPLGTVVGLYELAIDFILDQQNANPKRVGSTATISRAYEQLKSLYGQEENMVQFFPQPYISIKDNFFSRTEPDKTARKYIGIYANSSPSYKTTQYRTLAALTQAAKSVNFGATNNFGESYQTIVSYFNTLKNLGHAKSLLADDIPQHMRVIHRNWSVETDERKFLQDYKIVELTSRVPSNDLATYMDRLFVPSGDSDGIDFCLATNMISVGVDVPRLSNMVINMQPKSTSEYIQASSRVGRGRVPGIVWMLYAPNRARDRSHFEQFQFFHSTLQKNVEPSSVTPFAKPARERALPGVLISILRNSPSSIHMDTPSAEISSEQKENISNFLIKRCLLVDPQEVEDLKFQLEEFFNRWLQGFECYPSFNDAATSCRRAYVLYGQEIPHRNQRPQPYSILSSMRSVDIEESINYFQI
jgi:hypothetical protein